MTKLLYQTDAYLKEFKAHVTAAEGSTVVLDRTAFYATGGGQPHDTGTLSVGGQVWEVTEVRKQGNDVWHIVQGDGLPDVGAEVRGAVDWERRHKQSR
jgi:misacylated tRNA(Ala) deacylase